MKRITLAVCLIGLLIGCNNDKNNETSTEAAPVSPGADNVNGNLPDTSGSIKLNQPLPKDSSSAPDSIRR